MYLISTVYCVLLLFASSLEWCDNKLANTLTSVYTQNVPKPNMNPRNNLPTPEMIRANGYQVETHYATTEDGYILALHRIPHGHHTSPGGPAILLTHALLCSSADFVLQYPAKGLGYILAEQGYDVWLGNFRGNTYSRNHTTLNPEAFSGDFWKFSWDEMAKYDLPAMFELVLETSGKGDLIYVGHGLGATSFLAMHHYRKDLTSKVRLANLMGPTVYAGNMVSPIAWMAGLDNFFQFIFNLMGNGEFMPSSLWIDCLASLFCHDGGFQGVCENALFLLVGFDAQQMNETLFESIMHHTPAGTSTFTILQFAQEVISDGFHGYDWGSKASNLAHHGPEGVPDYPPQEVDTPIAIYWGNNDWLADPQDVQRLMEELPNIVDGMIHQVPYDGWTHMDFLWGIDANEYVYSDLLQNIDYCAHADCWV